MTSQFIVEVFKRGQYLRRRVFRTREAAVAFSNDFYDSHEDGYQGYQLQIVHEGKMEQMGANGNNR